MLTNVQRKIYTTVILTPCVLTRKDRTYAAVLKDTVEMEKLVQVCHLGQ